jgi:hypothetical protein
VADAHFSCFLNDPFDLFALRGWVTAERSAGRLPASGDVSIEVVHPNREAEGSCRWCGARRDEIVVVDAAGRLA